MTRRTHRPAPWRFCLALGLIAAGGGALRTAAGESPAAEPPSVPLAPRSAPRGATLFTTLPPGQTGLTAVNAYDDPAMWGPLYHEFNSGSIGTGVALGPKTTRNGELSRDSA